MEEYRNIQVGEQQLSYLHKAEEFAKVYDKDIIPGKYEGGFTLWECTTDLIDYIKDIDFKGKTVLEIGCGHGLVGILSLLRGAQSVTFADFNKDVLESLTTNNIIRNAGSEALKQCSFLYGDWLDMQSLGVTGESEFDLILGSEVIYCCQNYEKVIHVIKNYLKKGGMAILANKICYFGVGGSVPEFKQYLQKHGLNWETLKKIVPQSGNKKEIISVTQ